MIDVEAEYFNEIAESVLAEFENAYLTSTYEQVVPRFPAVSVVQMDNTVAIDRIDSSNTEQANLVSYDVNVYSNLERGAKAQCKGIFQIVDTCMRNRNFVRTYTGTIANAVDPSVTRLNARYTGLVDKDHVFYRR